MDAQGWRPIETAPDEDGFHALISDGSNVESGTWNSKRRQWQVWTEDGWWQVETIPTHWQPLPPPPAKLEP